MAIIMLAVLATMIVSRRLLIRVFQIPGLFVVPWVFFVASGTDVQTVNKLLKMHQEMARAMKQIKKMGGLKGLAAMFGGGGAGRRYTGVWR